MKIVPSVLAALLGLVLVLAPALPAVAVARAGVHGGGGHVGVVAHGGGGHGRAAVHGGGGHGGGGFHGHGGSHGGFHHHHGCCFGSFFFAGPVFPFYPWWGWGGWGYPYPAYSYPGTYDYATVAPTTSYQSSVGVQAPNVQREVVYPNGKYVLYGDGVTQPWQWVWVPNAPAPPPQPTR